MVSEAVRAVTFVFSSVEPPPDGFFQGYLFAGHDFVFGEEGVRAYTAATGESVTGGLDGCYVVVRQVGEEFHFDLDQSGYKLLFYYSDSDFWVVSNSLARLVDHLRDQGREVAPNYASLAGFLASNVARLQMSTFETVVRGVRLAPRGTTLVASPRGVRLLRHAPPAVEHGYAEALRNHLHTWVSRMETLVADPMADFSVQVTGGVDSRTNVGLAQAALQRLGGTGRPPLFSCYLYAGVGEDLVVATELAEHYGFELNEPRTFARAPLTPQESIEVFHALNAGVSSPLHLPVEGPSSSTITVSGTGGEIHRAFYELRRPMTPEQFVVQNAARPVHGWLSDEAARDLLAALEDTDLPLRQHYREFRNRFHGGRSPRYQTTITPLDSVTAHLAQSRAGTARLDAGQFNYDLLASLSPALLDIAFDEPEKAPTDHARAALTVMEIPREPSPGRVWSGQADGQPTTPPRAEQTRLLRDLVDRAAESRFVGEFWGDRVVVRARDVVQRLVDGSPVQETESRLVGAVLAAELVAPRVPAEIASALSTRETRIQESRATRAARAGVGSEEAGPADDRGLRAWAGRLARRVSGSWPGGS